MYLITSGIECSVAEAFESQKQLLLRASQAELALRAVTGHVILGNFGDLSVSHVVAAVGDDVGQS